jgi:hypothetical protein
MKVLVCGSRTWDDADTITLRLLDLPANAYILHGAAHGADQFAAEAAVAIGIPQRAFPADWNTYGKRAGVLRNIAMLDEGPDVVIAFWDGQSRGTKHTIDEAKRRGIPVEVIREDRAAHMDVGA